ncbi:Ribosomal RNA large subunit methyltransferase K/L [Rubripirellula tenax]|uniref:Ribosomal RNA large subunit methyltransferase K/L n=1 Tax=Rubripirellula tenax TaxID=2528015 RepID=A0A5C6ENR0_9BACT|nr:class I SAM-dependent methyltransferase [Rubripirellula tenax]TWU50518.1 Ribosomal RNA large subunit methyltransferase K/L [Rubripirellula tenax]
MDDQYRLLDFGDGRKLESVGGYLIDRPCPAAAWSKPADKSKWQNVDARYDADTKRWTYHSPWPKDHSIQCEGFKMPSGATPFGHIGFFPEQADNWRWLAESEFTDSVPTATPNTDRPKGLNLFGYTGASTLAMIRGGFQVAHVDAAKPNVHAVRIAAKANGWDDPPIRYLVDDAAKFAAREVRRDKRYHTIVLDPPAYGHGPSGRSWRLERDLWPLLEDCLRLIDANRFRLLISGHSPEVDQGDVTDFLSQSKHLDPSSLRITSGRSQLTDQAGRALDTGFFVRVER